MVLAGGVAISNSGIAPEPRFKRTNGDTAANPPVPAADAPETMLASVTLPTFYFDDDHDALSDRRSATTGASANPAPHDKPMHSVRAAGTLPDVLTIDSRLEMPGVEGAADSAVFKAQRRQANGPDDAVLTHVEVKAGDSLVRLLGRQGVKVEQMKRLLDQDLVKTQLVNLRIGQVLDVRHDADGHFLDASIDTGRAGRIAVRPDHNGMLVASILDIPIEKERVVTSGTIQHSLYLAAEQANLKQSTIMSLANIFQWELDFARDIRPGDQFSIVYDRLYREGNYIGDGEILAAEFVRGNRTYRAFRFTTDDGHTAYYSEDGKAKQRTFMRHPVDVVRITSRFDPNRLHPVLKERRAHRGVDYGSPHGSPIYATADGTVTYSGQKGAYGNTVILKHGNDITTLYAHMSRISDKSQVGKRVKQGEVIGYVGHTGRVTGTHLHYEFRLHGTHVDPLKVELPAAAPLDTAYLPELHQYSENMLEQMRSVLVEETMVAGTNVDTVLSSEHSDTIK